MKLKLVAFSVHWQVRQAGQLRLQQQPILSVWNDAFCNPIAQFATLMQRPAYYLTFALDGTAAAIKRFFDKRKKKTAGWRGRASFLLRTTTNSTM